MTDQGYQPAPELPQPAPTRVCRKCSTQAATIGDHCPNCGASYIRRGVSKRAKITVVASGLIILLLAGAVIALAAKNSHDKTRAAQQRRAATSSSAAVASRSAASAASSSASAAAEAKQIKDDAERARRKDIVAALEKSVTKDAKKDVQDGVLNGPIKKTACTPVGGGSTDLLVDTTGQFSCIAVTTTNSDGTESGYRFSAVVNWTDASYSWHLGS